jgi:predicted alpha/beta hydrolase family esterase
MGRATGGSDTDYFWFEDTKRYLESIGYEVWWPLLPDTDKPELQKSLEFLDENSPDLDEESIIIAHSSACPLALSYLENSDSKVNQVILVSGFYQSIDDDGFSELMLQKTPYNWQKIKDAANEIILINSDDDPWGCDDNQARPAAGKLGARFILAKGQGHMGSASFNQPYREFPLIKELIF